MKKQREAKPTIASFLAHVLNGVTCAADIVDGGYRRRDFMQDGRYADTDQMGKYFRRAIAKTDLKNGKLD